MRDSQLFNLGAAVAMVSAQLAPLPLPVLGAIAMAPALAQSRTMRINCYSSGDRTTTCDLPPNTQSVTYLGPDRSGRCREGDTWRRRGNQIQVTGGCGGTFEAVTYGSGGGNWGGSGSTGGSWGGSGGSWGGSGGSNQGFAGEVTCRSRDGRTEECYANTQGRVVMLQQYSSSPCREGQTWRYDRNTITVRNGCQARFGYGYGNQGGGGGGWGSNQGFAGQIECRSQDNRYRRCNAYTDNRVELLRQFSSTNCTRGRNWGYDRNSIWVDNGCQARFGYGYGNVSGDTSGDGSGSDAGAVVGGIALAAGLVALLAAAGKSSSSGSQSRSATTAAKLDADIARFPTESRPAAQLCLNEAARQIGQIGGTAVRLDQVDAAQRSGEQWMVLARVTATYEGKPRAMTMDCRATNSQVTAFDMR